MIKKAIEQAEEAAWNASAAEANAKACARLLEDSESRHQETIRLVTEFVEERADPNRLGSGWWELLIILENCKTGEG